MKFQFVEQIRALLSTVRCSAFRAALGSPFGRAVGAADWEGKTWPYQRTTVNWKTPGGYAVRWPPHERKLWYLFLRKYPVKVYKQRIVGRFIADFYCASAKSVIELDGSQHYEPQGTAYDSERSAFLTALGLKVLHFSNWDVDMNFRGVCTQIDITIQKRL